MLDEAKKSALGDIRKLLKDGMAAHLKKKYAAPKEAPAAVHVAVVKAEPVHAEPDGDEGTPEEEAAETPGEEAAEGGKPDMKALILKHLGHMPGKR